MYKPIYALLLRVGKFSKKNSLLVPCTHELGWFGTEIREGDIRYQLGVVPMGPNVNAFEKDLEAFFQQ